MPVTAVDLTIEARWIVPMTERNEVLSHHSIVVRDGRILDILPSSLALERYAATSLVNRTSHLLMPGMVNAHADASVRLLRGRSGAVPSLTRSPELARDSILAAIAEMLKSGITCFSDCHFFADQTAKVVIEQGMRAVIGMPVAEGATPWAENAARSLTRSLQLRDEFKDHPLVSMAFAVHSANAVTDSTYARLAILANELDCGIMLELHRSQAEIDECRSVYGLRPIDRMARLGLLTPALNAIHMTRATPSDIMLAKRTGIAISLCPRASLRSGEGMPPLDELAAAELHIGLGSAGATSMSEDIWGDMKWSAQPARTSEGGGSAWDALLMATGGGAAALGAHDEIGTLARGKWADLCCVDMSGPTTSPVYDPLQQLVLSAGRENVSDVWIAGRHLLANGELTRLDWPGLAARSSAWAARFDIGG